jgi:hypothetical protein
VVEVVAPPTTNDAEKSFVVVQFEVDELGENTLDAHLALRGRET